MTRYLALAASIAAPAFAQDTAYWGGQSFIRLQPTKAPGAVAEVIFQNAEVHTDSDETHTLDLGGFAVEVDMVLGRGMTPDRMTVRVPEGYIAVPGWVDTPEGETRVITIYSTEGAGA
jgi:hypothetical protein